MTDRPQEKPEGLRMYDELMAVHTIMRRGSALTAAALHRLAAGERPDIGALVRLARWQDRFTRHHHASEDELFWPLLRELFPAAAGSLDELAAEHERLDAALDMLSAGITSIEAAARMPGPDALAAATGLAAIQAASAADTVRDTLASHLDAEEPALRELFPKTPPADIRRLRKAIIAGAPRSGPDLVLGLLEDPVPAPGYAALTSDLPRPVRLLRPLLVRRYTAVKARLGIQPSPARVSPPVP